MGFTLTHILWRSSLSFFFLLSLFPLSFQAQNLKDSLLQSPSRVISNIPLASDLEIDGEGNIYLLEAQGNWITKLLAIAAHDSAVRIGGKSHRAEGLFEATKMVVPNRQQLYVLDEGQSRILLFNTNLKPINQIDFGQRDDNWQWLSAGEEIYPSDMNVAPTGDLFILNRYDNKVLKINTFGEFELSFGGTDYGEGALYAPVEIAANQLKQVMVSDTLDQELFVFNLFGIFQYTLQPKTTFRWQRFQLAGPFLICYNSTQIYFEHLSSGRSKHLSLEARSAGKLIDVKLGQDFLYLLFENAIHLHDVR